MDLPPRPPRRAAGGGLVAHPAPPTELDGATRDLLSKAIARAVAESLGHVRISSVPPGAIKPEGEPEPESRIRTSLRVAAKATTKTGKAAVFVSGALSLAGSAIALFVRPEYAAPLAQALKLIANVAIAAMGGGPPTGDASP